MEASITIFIILLQSATYSPVIPLDLTEIPIYVMDTWEIAYTSQIQGICYNPHNDLLYIRSSTDGKIYLADPDDQCSLQGEIALPEGIEGFGIAVLEEYPSGRFYINSSTDSQIYHSDGSDSWTGFDNPAGTGGAGMSFDHIQMSSDLFQVSAGSPYQFYSINTNDYTYESHPLTGVSSEISGFLVHEVATLDGYDPTALMVTTRFGHEFLFYMNDFSNGYELYGQEDCPVTVEESLGLCLDWGAYAPVYWAYKGTDGKYYISNLAIPVFGGIENESRPVPATSLLGVSSNPSTGGAEVNVNLIQPGFASLCVFDLSGKLIQTLYSGPLGEEGCTFSFYGPPGVYTAVLNSAGGTAPVRFTVTE